MSSNKGIQDKIWLWSHEAGSHTNPAYYNYKVKGTSRITPAEAALYMGIQNIIMVKYHDKPAPPYDQYMLSLSPFKRVVWSIVGDGSSASEHEIPAAKALAAKYPCLTGVMMDDFFERGITLNKTQTQLSPYTPEQLAAMHSQLVVNARRLDLWVVLYKLQLDLPLAPYIEHCDVINYWTYRGKDLATLETDFEKLEQKFPKKRKTLGCYMYDYGSNQELPVSLMEKQCNLGLRWLKEGRIEGIVFLGSCICDLGLETVEWSRQWIRALA